MNWYGTTGSGSVSSAGTRAADPDAMTGTAVMYDAGRILTLGGAPNYQDDNATANAHVITISGTSTVSVRKVASMRYPRAYHNSVVLPDGKVVVFGGQNFPVPFSDNTAVLSAELWDPATEQFTTMAPAAVPRTYHSVALLMPDGRVFSGGGGLCGDGCAANHPDGAFFSPPYLFQADGSTPAPRPALVQAPTTARLGAAVTVATTGPVAAFDLIRLSATTHTVNTDQRRVPLAFTPGVSTNTYALRLPADPGVVVPGYWMLFAIDSAGVPSIATTVRIG
jgi:galactose oxidase